MMKDYIDVTMPLKSDQMGYPGDLPCKVIRDLKISEGDMINISSLSFSAHTGTHMDAPFHFFDNGQTIDRLSLSHLIGKAIVFDFSEKNKFIDKSDLSIKKIDRGDIVILKTKNSKRLLADIFDEDFVYITKSAAEYLVEKGIKTFGFDYLSVDQFGLSDYPVHNTLLKNDIVIIEGIDLNEIDEGVYDIIALPLKIKDGDGAPARVLLKPIG